MRCAAAFFLVLAACSGDPTAPGEASEQLTPDLRPDGPLQGVVLVSEAKPDGSFSDPQLAFTTDDTEVTAIVTLGSEVEEASKLTIEWSSWSSFDKREPLFSHEIAVGPGGHAFSQGVSAKGLAPGVYETVATLGEREVRTPWVVNEAAGSASAGGAGGAGGALALFSPLAQAYSSEDWETPSAGDSGWYEPEETPQEPAPPGPCQLTSVNAGFVPMAGSNGSVGWIGECSDATLSATVSGPPVEVAGQVTAFPGQGFARAQTQACDLPGGSDLPGTVVKWTGDVGEGGTASDSITLPDFGETLQAVIQAPDNTPTRVDPGYRIVLRGMAIVVPPALGVEKLDVAVGDQVLNSVGNASETAQPEPCDPGRLGAVNRTSYTVPESPPPIIDVCAKARGFDGTEAESCIQFYTGEVWEGTFTYDFSGPTLTCSSTYSVKFGVQEGEVSGEITMETNSCPGAAPRSSLTGTRTDDAFTLKAFSPGDFSVPITDGNRASATFSSTPEEIRVFEVRCVNC